MGLLSFFRKTKTELSEEQVQWNKMWALWAEGRADSPYAELMTYQSEVNNGGHDQYFSNIESSEKMQKQMATLETVLSAELQSNLRHARSAFQSLSEKEEDEEAEAALEQCDEIFREREDEINSILNAYAAALDR